MCRALGRTQSANDSPRHSGSPWVGETVPQLHSQALSGQGGAGRGTKEGRGAPADGMREPDAGAALDPRTRAPWMRTHDTGQQTSAVHMCSDFDSLLMSDTHLQTQVSFLDTMVHENLMCSSY